MVFARRIPWVLAVVVFLVIVIFSTPVSRGWLGRLAVTTTRPVAKFSQILQDRVPSISGSTTISNERDILHKQLEVVTTKLYQANIQLETVQATIKLSDYQTSSKHTLIQARVISTSPDPGIQSIVIDRGSNDGITIGQVALAEHGSVIGKVVAVHQNQSSILLLSDKQSVMAVRIQNKQQSPGIIRGERGLTLKLNFIPKTDTINVSDTVVTSGTEIGIPPDILIGSISITQSLPGDLFQSAIVTPAAPYNRLRIVAIVKQ